MEKQEFDRIHEQALEEAEPAGPEIEEARKKMEEAFHEYMNSLEEYTFKAGFRCGYRKAKED